MRDLKSIIKEFGKIRLLVVGDLILDEYIIGSVDRISPEAPVPVVWANKRSYVPGGAANVANNITSLDGRASLTGVTGKDDNADVLFKELKSRRIDTEGIFAEESRLTTVKTRIIGGHQQIVRVDWEHREPLSSDLNGRIIKFVTANIDNLDGLIIEDYGKGVVNQDLLEELVNLANSRKKVITIDPKEEHFQYYRGATSITPNRRELENAVRNLKIKDTTNTFKINDDKLFTDKDIESAAWQVLEYLGLESVLVTLGENGMKLFEKGGSMTHIPTVAQKVFDVSGAGDTVIATFTMALSAGASKLEAAHIANFAAGIVVGKVGTATTTRDELSGRIG